MRELFRRLRQGRFRYAILIRVLIYKNEILHNLNVFRKRFPKIGIAPVLKSNAYGHGLLQVARLLDAESLPFFCVDSFFEALILRNEGIQSSLLIIGYTPLENVLANKLKNVAFAVISLEELERFVHSIRDKTRIHLKLDTGMHRHGILPEEIPEAINILKRNPRIILEGVYSHLADADTENSKHAELQIVQWNEAVAQFKKEFPNTSYFHLGATAGSRYSSQVEANVLRIGIGLYGISLGPEHLDLHPALEMKTRVTSLRTLQAGESVGYNATFTAKVKTEIASIPAGYTEGIDRRLSNKGTVTIRGVGCPIVGRVSMNITSIDISAAPVVRLDDEVTVISKEKGAPNSIERMAELCNTISYDLLVHIPQHLRREVI